ncbi:MAG: DUF4131 domain-containing protein [Cyanobacteria bacterium CRU_2_1]|nr:DUF4131 domain-containing protein [Cyanobacteria bacterium CRU_2_1]
MTSASWAVICFAYILSLLLTGISGEVRGIPVGAIVLLITGVLSGFFIPRLWRTGPKSRIWWIAGVIGFLAILYFQWRVPTPKPSDISELVNGTAPPSQMVVVKGYIDSSPRLTRSQKIQFELETIAVQSVSSRDSDQDNVQTDSKDVTGKVYATVPLLQGTGLYPGQKVAIIGSLYKPKPVTNPGGFDFEKYLAQQGIFAGLKGKKVDFLEEDLEKPPILWSIRRRIVRSQVQGLGVPEGPLVSAMVIGHKTVDIPFDLRDQFVQVGLAAALAASGFQTSLLIWVVLTLSQRLKPWTRFWIGVSVLGIYIGLTGFEPSVLRAGLMGIAALGALSLERKVKPLASLLLAAVILLVLNPLWIWDLGFELSFLATLGLLVTVPMLNKWLDWVPRAIAPLIAVPIAAYLWTLPVQLFAFGVFSPYSIIVNILTAPLVAIISIGGMISALLAFIYPMAGSVSAWLLHYPTSGLIAIVEFFGQLPGTAFATGTIHSVQVIALYGLFGLIWWNVRWWRYWWVAGVVGISLIAIPSWYTSTTLLQATVLSTSKEPVMVIQDKGKVGLINSSDAADVRFTVLPFLQKQGINRIDWAIAPHLHPLNLEGWKQILAHTSIQTFYSDSDVEAVLNQQPAHPNTSLPMSGNQTVQLGSTQTQLISVEPSILKIQVADQTWLLLSDLPPVEEQARTIANFLPPAQVLWWSGKALSLEVLERVKPKTAIASARSISLTTEAWFQKHAVTIYLTGQDGAIQWTPHKGFTTAVGLIAEESVGL